jgi:hypothetical protein
MPLYEYNYADMDPLEQVLRRTEAIVNDDGWDAKPHFYTLEVLVGDALEAEVREKLRKAGAREHFDGALAIAEMAMPEFCYENPAEGLPTFLRLTYDLDFVKENRLDGVDIMKMLDLMVPVNLYGLGLIFEGWKLPDSVSEEERAQHSREHTMHEHPDRIEIRNMIVVTSNGRSALLSHSRGGFPEYNELTGPEERLAGRVPNAMYNLLAVFVEFNRFRTERIHAPNPN